MSKENGESILRQVGGGWVHIKSTNQECGSRSHGHPVVWAKLSTVSSLVGPPVNVLRAVAFVKMLPCKKGLRGNGGLGVTIAVGTLRCEREFKEANWAKSSSRFPIYHLEPFTVICLIPTPRQKNNG